MYLHIIVLGIGVYMVSVHHKTGWTKPPVLSGIAFILIAIAELVGKII